MKIDRLEIKGFKSFPDKTTLRFKPGVSAVVGPNGCGKSNLIDAIRWVMGEQRVRSLRGKKMEDVIFNGSDSRKPVGLAEVKLILTDTRGEGPPALKDYDEIMITRRLFRDGESHYEINNVPCRLSDITDFFLDSGVGKNSYAIIEQGRVDMVVASKPEDRRLLIEEAAGISRYKARREAALKKLEQTKQNLLRISDVISEVKRQSASLKRQAAKADKHRKLTERLRELDINLHSHKAAHIQEALDRDSNELQQINDQLGERQTRQAQTLAALESDRAESLAHERELSDSMSLLHRVELELGELRSRNESSRAGLKQLEERSKENRSSLEDLDQRSKSALGTLDELNSQRSEVMKELDLCRQKLSESEERSAGIRERRGLEQKRVEKLKEDLFGLLQASSQATNKKESLKRRHAEIRAQAARHGAEKEGREKELSELRNRADNLALQEERLNERRNSNQDMVSTLESEKSRITGRLGELNRSLKSLENQLGAQRGKLSSLEELRDSFSAYGEGAKSLLKEDSEWSSKTILAVAGELVDVDEEFQPALVAALAEKVDYLVVESLAEALEGVERLETRSAGRAAFIPRDAIHQESGGPEARNHELTPLIDLVSAREGFEDVVDHLLKKTVLVQDLKAAARSYSESEGAFDYVTRDGRSLSRWGIVAGGAQTTGAGEIFRIKNEIRALYSEISLNESSSARLQDELNDMDLELAEKNGQLESIRTTLGEIKVEEARLRKDMETIQEQIKNCGLSVDALEKEIQGLDSERERVEKEQITLEEQISRLSLRRSEMEAEKAQAQESLAQCDSQLDQISARTGDDRIKVAQLDERAKSLSREIHAAQSSKEQIAGQLESMKSRIKGDDEEAERLRAELGVSSEKEKSLMERHSNIRARVEELKELTGKLSEKIKSLENETKQRGKDLGALKDQAHALETRAVRHEQSLTDIVEKIVERHGVDPRRVAPETPPATPEEIASLKERIESMGQVNLAAIDESRQTEERLNFLMEQEGDLQAAVDSLYTTINRINRTTRDRFQEAFDLINSKFQEIFPFLFRGGEARLELTDAEDLLETGVDILARPPGKRIQNMSLLSGGEKALTAVALIFSIFLIRPSPFCLLDEVDAPLDDANLSMFNEMLRRLSDATQFILITHNKASMERADSLYGVTMAQAGVSNLVSVEFMDKEAV